MSGTRDLRDLEKMSFLGLQEGLTDEDLLGSRTATGGRGNIPPQPPSFTEWQQPPRPPPRVRGPGGPGALSATAYAMMGAGGAADSSSSSDEDAPTIPMGVPIPAGRATGKTDSVQDWDDEWDGKKPTSSGYSSPPPPSTLSPPSKEAGAAWRDSKPVNDPDLMAWDRRKDPNFDQSPAMRGQPAEEGCAGAKGGWGTGMPAAPKQREVDGDPLCRHKWDMGTWRDGLKASPPPEKQAPAAHNEQQQQQQPLLHEEHHHHLHNIEHHEHHHHHAAPGDAAARVRANMANAGSPSAPSIGVQAEFGVPPAATAPVVSSEAGGGVFEDDDGSGEESGDDNARIRRGKTVQELVGDPEKKKKKKKKSSMSKTKVYAALPAVPGLEGLESMSKSEILARFSKRSGWLRKVNDPTKNWQLFKDVPIYCHCENLSLWEYKDEAQYNAGSKPKNDLDLTGCCVTSHKSLVNAFELHTSYMFRGKSPPKVHIYLCKDEEDKVNWIRTITLQGVIHPPRLV